MAEPRFKTTKQPRFGNNPVAEQPAAVPPPGGGVSSANPDDVGFWGTVGDMLASVPSGAAKGLAETGMFLSGVTPTRMAAQSEDQANKLWANLHPGEEEPWWRKSITDLVGLPQVGDAMDTAREATFGAQDVVRKTMDENLYQPRTPWGRGTEELASFLAPAAWPSRITRLATGPAKIGNWVADLLAHGAVPYAGYKAGEALGGPELGAVLATMAGAGGGVARSSFAPEMMIKRAMEGTDAGALAAAHQLEQTGEGLGVRLSPAESIAQVTNQPGHPILKALRMAEASPSGSLETGPFFEPRSGPSGTRGTIDQAISDVLDRTVGAPPINPQTVGPQVAEAARGVQRQVEGARTAATQPYYAQADPQLVDRPGMDQLLTDIETAAANERSNIANPPLRQLQQALIAEPAREAVPPQPTPVLDQYGQPIMDQGTPAQPAVPHLDVNTLDTILKAYNARINAREPGLDAIPGYQRGLVTPFLTRLEQMMQNASLAYGQAKDTHGLVSRAVVGPVEHGPIGDLAKAADTEAAGKVLLTPQPQANMTNAVIDAVQRVGQRTGALPGLLRQRLDQIWSDVGKATRGGNRQWAGAELEKALRGRPEATERLTALAQQLGQPGSPQQLGDLLDVLQATGRRLQEGSPTAALNTMYSDLSASPVTAALETGLNKGQNIGSAVAGMISDWNTRANARRVGELLTGSVRNLQAEIERTALQAASAGASRAGLASLYNLAQEPNR